MPGHAVFIRFRDSELDDLRAAGARLDMSVPALIRAIVLEKLKSAEQAGALRLEFGPVTTGDH